MRFIAITLVFLGFIHTANAQQDAAGFIQQTANALTGAANSPQRDRIIEQLVDQHVDVEGAAGFVLGRFRNNATPEQQTEFTQLFRNGLIKDLLGNLGSGASVSITGQRQQNNGVLVSTSVQRPNNTPARVEWFVVQSPNGWQIIDMIVEGTSLRVTRRSDYASIASKQGVSGLLDAMRRRYSS